MKGFEGKTGIASTDNYWLMLYLSRHFRLLKYLSGGWRGGKLYEVNNPRG
jgi:hypothetical protein